MKTYKETIEYMIPKQKPKSCEECFFYEPDILYDIWSCGGLKKGWSCNYDKSNKQRRRKL